MILIQQSSELRNNGLRPAVDYSENSGSGIAELQTSGSALQKKKRYQKSGLPNFEGCGPA
jgi:hypothetical protein